MLTPVSASCRRATAACAFGAHLGDFLLDEAGFKRGGESAGCLDLLEQRPGRFAKLVGQVFHRAGAGGRIGDFAEVRFFREHKLGVARDAARKAVRQAERGGERQHRDRVGAAERGGEHGDRRAQHIHVRIAPRHHAPRGLGRDEAGFGASPQARSTRAHNFRSARNFAMVRNWSASAASRK